jgi:hypothetical protein
MEESITEGEREGAMVMVAVGTAEEEEVVVVAEDAGGKWR